MTDEERSGAQAHGQMRSAYGRDWLSRADARARFADFFEEMEPEGRQMARSREGDLRARISVVYPDDSVREPARGVASSAVPKRTRGIRRFLFPITLVFGFAAVHASQVVPVAARGQMHGDVREDVRERSSVMASNRALALLASVAGVAGLSCVDGALGDAVEWRVADGGNGHWYEVVPPAYEWRDWYLVKALAERVGGYLVVITTEEENRFLATSPVFAPIDSSPAEQFWLGGIRVGSQWTWINGDSWKYLSWDSSPSCYEPNVQPDGTGRWLAAHCRRDGLLRWNDMSTDLLPDPPGFYLPMGYIIEYSADCNSNGIVDYGEIRNGFIEDTNGNNIPDACECAADPSLPICCPADVIEDSAVNAIDLAAILNTWGTDGGKFPRADVDGSGVVDGADLAAVLSEWGPCAK